MGAAHEREPTELPQHVPMGTPQGVSEKDPAHLPGAKAFRDLSPDWRKCLSSFLLPGPRNGLGKPLSFEKQLLEKYLCS